MKVCPSQWKPGLVYIDACEHVEPEQARRLAARILRVAARVEKKAKPKARKP